MNLAITDSNASHGIPATEGDADLRSRWKSTEVESQEESTSECQLLLYCGGMRIVRGGSDEYHYRASSFRSDVSLPVFIIERFPLVGSTAFGAGGGWENGPSDGKRACPLSTMVAGRRCLVGRPLELSDRLVLVSKVLFLSG